MPMRKYQKAEQATVATPIEHEAIESNLHKLGKTSAASLNDDERRKLDKPTHQ